MAILDILILVSFVALVCWLWGESKGRAQGLKDGEAKGFKKGVEEYMKKTLYEQQFKQPYESQKLPESLVSEIRANILKILKK